MQPSEDERLQHMLDAAREAIDLLGNATPDAVRDQRILALSLVKLIELVGEAASHVSVLRRAQIAGVDWSKAIATRNRLIHGYHDIDHAIVVQTIREDFPPIVTALRAALQQLR
jgi:uncharacterized protein with HEPN domain